MCRKCRFTTDEWRQDLLRRVDKLALPLEDRVEIKDAIAHGKDECKWFDSDWDDAPRVIFPEMWKCNVVVGPLIFTELNGDTYDCELHNKLDAIVRDYAYFIYRWKHDDTDPDPGIRPHDYLDHLHPHRRRAWSWYLFGAVGDIGCDAVCARCEALENASDSELEDIEFDTGWDDAPGFGTGYYAAASVQHLAAHRSDEHFLCWRYFPSACANDKYLVFQLDRPMDDPTDLYQATSKVPLRNCGACYYFTEVLNELTESTLEWHAHKKRKESIGGIPCCRATPWPRRVAENIRVIDFNLLSREDKQRIIYEESDALADEIYAIAQNAWQTRAQGDGAHFFAK